MHSNDHSGKSEVKTSECHRLTESEHSANTYAMHPQQQKIQSYALSGVQMHQKIDPALLQLLVTNKSTKANPHPDLASNNKAFGRLPNTLR